MALSTENLFKIKWSKFDNTNFLPAFDSLINTKFCDCTLVANDGGMVQAHRILLTIVSPWFESVFSTPDTIVCKIEDLSSEDLSHVLEFIYTRSVKLSLDQLDRFIRIAESMQIRGIIGFGMDFEMSSNRPKRLAAAAAAEAMASKSCLGVEIDGTAEIPGSNVPSALTFSANVSTANDNASKTVTIKTRGKKKQQETVIYDCCFCFSAFSTQGKKNSHERYCDRNPKRSNYVICPDCNELIKPGSITGHRVKYHGYVKKSRRNTLWA